MRWIALLCVCAALAGCGSGDADESSAPPPATTTASRPPPSGPIVRICDRALAASVRSTLGEAGYGGAVGPPRPAGSDRLSSCVLHSPGATVQLSLDAAPDAVQRYMNRVTESSQFSSHDRRLAPQTVKGVGDRRLGGTRANWVPAFHELYSARGSRVLIVSFSARRLADPQLRDAAIALSLYAYRRLEGPLAQAGGEADVHGEPPSSGVTWPSKVAPPPARPGWTRTNRGADGARN